MNWNIETLKRELNKNTAVKAWIISHEHVHRRERYFMTESSAAGANAATAREATKLAPHAAPHATVALAIDQDREVNSQGIEVRIMVHLLDANLEVKPTRQGEITKKLFTSMPLLPQLDSALKAAAQTDYQAWSLPTRITAQLPELTTTDPRMGEDLEVAMKEYTQKIQNSVTQKRDTVFNSAELFLSVHHRELHLSNGLTHRSSQSRAYSEAAYSYSVHQSDGQTKSDEYLNAQWAVTLDDLKVDQLFDETSERARHSLDTVKPVTGKYPVIVDAEVLALLFNNHATQLTAANAYNGLPFIKVGSEFVAGASGDLLTVSLDPTLAYGADTTALSDQGVPQSRLKLVDRNQVIATAADKRYADYLGTETTTVRGNLVVELGTHTHEALTRAGSRVLEILQFSGLFADPSTGTFSSEIRLAKLYDNDAKTVTYIKGGSLAGSFVENFKAAKLGSEPIKHAHFSTGSGGQGYFGPKYALLNDVSVVG